MRRCLNNKDWCRDEILLVYLKLQKRKWLKFYMLLAVWFIPHCRKSIGNDAYIFHVSNENKNKFLVENSRNLIKQHWIFM